MDQNSLSEPDRTSAGAGDVEQVPAKAGALLRAGIAGGALGGMMVGVLDGGLRTLGVDPADFYYKSQLYGFGVALERGLPGSHEVVGLLAFWAWTIGLGLGLGACLGGLLSLPLRVFARSETRMRSIAGGCVLGLWFGVALFWWTRPSILSGLPMSDLRRMGVAAAMLVGGLLLGPALALGAGGLLQGGARRARQSGLVAGVLLALVGGSYVALHGAGSNERGRINERNQDLPNVVVIVVDALRQDVLGCYGNEEIATPNIDRIASEGVLFEEAFAQAPFTWPSFGSFLTGKYPRRHGLIKMETGVRMAQNVTLPYHLARAKHRDGRALEDGDFATAALMTGTVSHGSGLLRGFDYYYEAIVGHDLVDVRNHWSRFRSGLLPALIKNKVTQRFDDAVVANVASGWIGERVDQRFLALVHLYSTHTAYSPAARYLEPYKDPDYSGPLSRFESAHVHAIQQGAYEPSPEDVAQVRALYSGGVTQADAHIGAVVQALEEGGVLDNTILIITSDHGESLGEYGYWEHNWMVQSNLRIPLILRYPPAVPAGQRVSARVDSIDLVPTVLDMMALESLAGVADLPAGTDPRGAGQALAMEAIDGVTLLPVIRGEVDQVRPYSFAENGPYRSAQNGRWKLVVERQVLEEGKFEHAQALPKVVSQEFLRLYDLEADPDERNNVAQEFPEITVDLIQVLRNHDASMPIRSDLIRLSHRDLDQTNLFGDLGYGGGVGDDGDTLPEEQGDQ